MFRKLNNDTLDIVFGVYESPSLFPRGQANATLEIASSIVSIIVTGQEINNLTDYVSINMTLVSEVYNTFYIDSLSI